MTIKPYSVLTNDGAVRHYMEFEKAQSMCELLQGLNPGLQAQLIIKEVIND